MQTQRFRECAWCGFSFPIKRDTAKYCTPSHRTLAYDQRKREGIPAAPPAPVAPVSPPVIDAGELMAVAQQLAEHHHDGPADAAAATGAVASATRKELETARKLDTAMGQIVMALAERVDAGYRESGSAFAQLVKELRAALAATVTAKAEDGEEDVMERMAREWAEELAGS